MTIACYYTFLFLVVHCLSFLSVICLLITLCNTIHIVIVMYTGACHWIVIDIIQYCCQWIHSCLRLFCFIVLYVCVCCDRCGFDVSSIACDSSAIGGKLYGVSTVMIIVVTGANYGPMVHSTHLHAGSLQLTLWEEMQMLVKCCCYFYSACLLVCCDICHHILVQQAYGLRQA